MDKNVVVFDRSLEKRDRNMINPELLKLIMLDDIQVTLTDINKSLKRTECEGGIDSKVLEADGKPKYIVLRQVLPYAPLVTAHFRNEGDKLHPEEDRTVSLSINGDPEIILQKGQSAKVDFTRAKKKIEFICYQCEPGKTASVRVVGKY